jgi:hypothetical protein
VVIKAIKGINIGAAAVINASGGNATPGTFPLGVGYESGCGGGSGGCIILQTDQTLTMAGTLNVSGGNGSNGQTLVVGANMYGGGGGGGGVVLLQAYSKTVTGTITLSGGAPGTNNAGANTAGGAGGSFGGAGGPGNGTIGSASPGVILYSGSPF